MPSHHGYKYPSAVVHQDPSRSSTYYSSNTSSSSRSSSHSTHSHSAAYNTMNYSTSSGTYGHGQEQYRSPYAKDYSVDVSRHGDTVVINHHRPNPSTDEPRSSDARDGRGSYVGGKHKDSRRDDSIRRYD